MLNVPPTQKGYTETLTSVKSHSIDCRSREIEPATPGLVVQCIIHYTTGPLHDSKYIGVLPGSTLCITFLNFAKHGEKRHFILPKLERNRIITGNDINSITYKTEFRLLLFNYTYTCMKFRVKFGRNSERIIKHFGSGSGYDTKFLGVLSGSEMFVYGTTVIISKPTDKIGVSVKKVSTCMYLFGSAYGSLWYI